MSDTFPCTVVLGNLTLNASVGGVIITILSANGNTSSFLSTLVVYNIQALKDAGIFEVRCGSLRVNNTSNLSPERLRSEPLP